MLFGLAGATLLTQAVVLERAVSEAPRAIAACRYPSLEVTNQAAAEKKDRRCPSGLITYL